MKTVKGNIENQFLSKFGPNINGCVLMFSCGCFLCHHVTREVAAWGYSVTPEELTIVRVYSLLFQREIILIFIIQDNNYQNITISYFKDCLNCKQHADMTTCVLAVLTCVHAVVSW